MDFQNSIRQFTTKYVVPFVNKIHHPWAYALLKRSRKNVWQSEYLRTNALLSIPELEEISPDLFQLFDPEVFLSKFYNISHIDSPISSYIYLDVKTRLPDLYMLEVERVTSAFAMQWHTPFLNKSIVEFAASIPIDKNLLEAETASPLKSILKSIFPPSVVNRPKRRRTDFLKDWTENSDLHILFKELERGTLAEVGIVDDQWIREAVKTPKNRNENFHYLWSILTLEVWFKLFINQPISPEAPNISVRDLLQED
jgi:asparagine synthase (glutamine-hydrolysing)